MSYRDPQQTIVDRYKIIAGHRDNMMKIISSGVKGITGNLVKMKAEKDKRKRKIEKRYANRMKTYEKDEAGIRKELYGQGPSDPKDAESYRKTIESELLIIRNGMAMELKNVDLTNSQVNEVQNLGLVDLNNLKTAVLTADAINSEEKKYGNLQPYEENALMTGKNEAALNVAGAINDGEKYDFYNTNYDINKPYKLGSANYAVSLYNEEGGYDETSSIDLGKMADWKKENKGESYFNRAQGRKSKRFEKSLDGLNKDILGDLIAGNPKLQTDGKLDPWKVKEYLKTDSVGKELVSNIFEDEAEIQGYLRTKAPKDTKDYVAYDQMSIDDPGFLVDILVEDAFFTVPQDKIHGRGDLTPEERTAMKEKSIRIEGAPTGNKWKPTSGSPTSVTPEGVVDLGGKQKSGTEAPPRFAEDLIKEEKDTEEFKVAGKVVTKKEFNEFQERWDDAKKGDIIKLPGGGTVEKGKK